MSGQLDGRLGGRVALVTGAGRGIGAETAERLAREGAAVVVNDLDGDECQAVQAALERAGLRAVAAPADVSTEEGARAVVSVALEAFGDLDIVVNNAGTTRDAMFHRTNIDDLQFVLRANLFTAFHVTQAAAVHLRPRAKALLAEDPSRRSCGKIVMASSTSFLKGNVGQSSYSAAKGAVIGLMRSLAREFAPLRINVNAVAPGFVATRMTGELDPATGLGMPDDARERAIASIPLTRSGEPDDIASAYAYLVSPDSDFLTGHVLVISGGVVL